MSFEKFRIFKSTSIGFRSLKKEIELIKKHDEKYGNYQKCNVKLSIVLAKIYSMFLSRNMTKKRCSYLIYYLIKIRDVTLPKTVNNEIKNNPNGWTTLDDVIYSNVHLICCNLIDDLCNFYNVNHNQYKALPYDSDDCYNFHDKYKYTVRCCY